MIIKAKMKANSYADATKNYKNVHVFNQSQENIYHENMFLRVIYIDMSYIESCI